MFHKKNHGMWKISPGDQFLLSRPTVVPIYPQLEPRWILRPWQLFSMLEKVCAMHIHDSREPSLPRDTAHRPSRSETAAMAVLMIAGAVGLTRLSIKVTSPSRDVLAAQHAHVNQLARSEADTIFVPAALEELANGLSDIDSLEAHDDIKRLLQRQGLEKTWYAIIYRVLQADGTVVVMPVYGSPFEATERVLEFRAVLAAIRGNPPRHPYVDYSTATIGTIPEELAKSEPGKAITEVIRQWDLARSQTVHQE